MKRTNFLIASLLAVASFAQAQQITGISVDQVHYDRSGDYMVVDMAFNLSNMQVDSRRAVLLTPRFVSPTDTLELPSIGVYGRQRYYYYLRNEVGTLSPDEQSSVKFSERPDTMSYHAVVPFREWMNGANLEYVRGLYGCCHDLILAESDPLGRYFELNPAIPEIVYIHPQGEGEKTESLEGSAFIDFPVDQTVIYPEYRNNVRELGKIQATIDSVRYDKDVTITQVWLKGYASPESPYSHNRDLAIGRTAALKEHINRLYRFGDGVVTTDYEPEDWAGLRRYVDQSNLEHRTEILAMIDASLEPDAKEAKIKQTYPSEYRFLLQNCYPALRHTDYRIDYRIRRFTNIEDLRRVLKSNPRHLDLNEFYLLSQACEPGSDEFNNVFETAVRMYPNDPVANVNAANAAMQRKDYVSAIRYLEKAGDTPQAIYARGALAFLQEDYIGSEAIMKQALAAGIPQAQDVLNEINLIKECKPQMYSKKR